MEYQSCGLPSIATNIGGNKEIIEDGINGYLYKAGNYRDLLSKIELVRFNRRIFLNLSKNSRRIIKRYSKEEMLREYSKIYYIDRY